MQGIDVQIHLTLHNFYKTDNLIINHSILQLKPETAFAHYFIPSCIVSCQGASPLLSLDANVVIGNRL